VVFMVGIGAGLMYWICKILKGFEDERDRLDNTVIISRHGHEKDYDHM
jgi:hypothetical protein